MILLHGNKLQSPRLREINKLVSKRKGGGQEGRRVEGGFVNLVTFFIFYLVVFIHSFALVYRSF